MNDLYKNFINFTKKLCYNKHTENILNLREIRKVHYYNGGVFMAFVYSVLSEEEKKELLDKYKFNDYFRRSRAAKLYSQIYDEQRNMRLVPVVGGCMNGKRNKPDRPYHWEIPIIFAFIWNEEICKIEIYYEIKKVNEKMFCYLEISRVVAPEFFRDKEKELTFWLKEALKKEKSFLMWDCEIVFPDTFPIQFTDKKGWNYE